MQSTSDSHYDSAHLSLYRSVDIYKDSTGQIDSTRRQVEANADFGQHFGGIGVRNVFLNADTLYPPNNQYPYWTYYRTWGIPDDNVYQHYDTNVWRVVSNNGSQDMIYAIKALIDFNGPIPYNISRSSDLTLTLDSIKYQDVDSLNIDIRDGNGQYRVDTTISTHLSAVTFSKSQMSALQYGSYNRGILSIGMGKNITYKSYSGKTYLLTISSGVGYDINIVQ